MKSAIKPVTAFFVVAMVLYSCMKEVKPTGQGGNIREQSNAKAGNN